MTEQDIGQEELRVVQVLFDVATSFSLQACLELERRLSLRNREEARDCQLELSPGREKRQPLVVAIEGVAHVLGHPPTTTEYKAHYEGRRGGDDPLPSLGQILDFFGTWKLALRAAEGEAGIRGLGDDLTADYRGRRPAHYSDQRLFECLQACAAELDRVPVIREYVTWREQRIPGRPGKRRSPMDIPAHTVFTRRFGGWSQALEAAGLDPDPKVRMSPRRYSNL